MLTALFTYFAILLLVSHITGKDSHNQGNNAFFRGNRKSPWALVAFGMVGASISGLTFIGVPGWVMGIGMTYMQMCLGFIVGYLVVAFVLLPIYYRLNLTSIYTYLEQRFDSTSYRTGASFFILSKLLGAAAKFYIVVQILQSFIGESINLPYWATAILTLLFIWLYTRRGGIRTLVWTDALQTLCLVVALILILLKVCSMLGLGFGEAMQLVCADEHSRMFEFSDVASKQYFWKQFLSGAFVVIVMTGLDQDMMQKNLTCRTLRSAQWNMCSYGMLFAPINFLFLALGVLLLHLYANLGLPLPTRGDELLSSVVLDGTLGTAAMSLFAVGVVASAFSSADSSVTALTTSYCIDIRRQPDNESLCKRTHIGMTLAFLACTLAFHALGSGSVMDLIYTLVSYTYGPLLGLFAFGIFTARKPRPKAVPYIAVASPLICYAIDLAARSLWAYTFGYEILMLNGILTFTGLWLFRENK